MADTRAVKYWFRGVPFAGFANRDTTGVKYWVGGLPAREAFKVDALAAALTGSSSISATLSASTPGHSIAAALTGSSSFVASTLTTVATISLFIKEAGVDVDETHRVWVGSSPMSFNLQRGARGDASVPLLIDPGDTFEPANGTPMSIFAGGRRRFAGTIDRLDREWIGDLGMHCLTLICVTLDQCMDVLQCWPPQAYENEKAGVIVAALFAKFGSGLPFTLGTVQDGPIIPGFYIARGRLSDVLADLASRADFIQGVDSETLTYYFQAPSTTAAPFTLTSAMLKWQTIKWAETRSTTRNRQLVQMDFAGASLSADIAAGDSTTKEFTGRFPIDQLVEAILTESTQATATGSFSGLPNDGDLITIDYVGTGSGGGGGGGSAGSAVSLSFNISGLAFEPAGSYYYAKAGIDFTVTVTAHDAFGNVATDYAGNVHFAPSDTGTYSNTPSDSPLTSGVGVFSVAFDNASTFIASVTLTISDPVNTGLTASASFVFKWGTPTSLQVVAPGTATAGTPFSFDITALDQDNQIYKHFGPSVAVTLTSDDALVDFPVNPVHLTNGTGTFTATFNTTGAQSIHAATPTPVIEGQSANVTVS